MHARFLDLRKGALWRGNVVAIPSVAPSGARAQLRRPATERPLDEAGLSRRARNVLRTLGCDTLADVARLPAGALEVARNCGPRTRSEIIDCVRERGVVLGESPTISARAVVVGWRRIELWDRGQVVSWCLAQDLARHPEWIDAIEDWAAQRVFRLVSFRRLGLRGLVRSVTGGAPPRVMPSSIDAC